jgi:hypothetical protein
MRWVKRRRFGCWRGSRSEISPQRTQRAQKRRRGEGGSFAAAPQDYRVF